MTQWRNYDGGNTRSPNKALQRRPRSELPRYIGVLCAAPLNTSIRQQDTGTEVQPDVGSRSRE